MDFIQIKENCYYFHSAVNIGYIVSQDRTAGMLIDSGLEASAAKKAISTLEKHNLPLTHLFITHAHADHFGGAQFIQKNREVHTIAPSLEESIMRNPILEPIYLFHGNAPLREMRNKFLEAPAIIVDEICEEGVWTHSSIEAEFIRIPGHSHNQFGLIYENVCYAADAFLGMMALQKHKIPFIVDAASNISTLNDLLNRNVDGMLPGHGDYSTAYKMDIQANIDVHQTLANQVYDYITTRGCSGISLEDLTAAMLNDHDIQPANLGMYTLFRTAISAYLIEWIEKGKAKYMIRDGRPVIFSDQPTA